MPYTMQIGISDQLIADVICTAFESGIEWIGSSAPIDWIRPEGHITPWYDDPVFMASDFSFTVKFDDPGEDEGSFTGDKIVKREDITKGFDAMAKHARDSIHWILNGNYDAGDADVFMQCVVLGEVMYA